MSIHITALLSCPSGFGNMSTLHFASALLPAGWADDVQVEVTDGLIAKVTAGVAPASGSERHQLAIPGIASLHSHAFQRGMAGLAEIRGDAADTFWTWRETMYRFALTMTPEDTQPDAPRVASPALDELSGLAVSHADPDLLWGHNDSGAGPDLYRIGIHGEDLGSVHIAGVQAIDWEDIAAFDWQGKPALLIADTGDNTAKRKSVTLYAVSDPGRIADRIADRVQ
eukprot:gene23316-30224_t